MMEAFDALEAMKEASIEKLLDERNEINNALEALDYDEGVKPKRVRKAVSPEGRRNMSAAQKRRREGGATQGEPIPQE